jgi:hypothetical protein
MSNYFFGDEITAILIQLCSCNIGFLGDNPDMANCKQDEGPKR